MTVTKADPDPQAPKRGRHTRSNDAEDADKAEDAAPTAEPPKNPAADDAASTRSRHPLGHHPAGVPLLTAAGLVTGLSLAPLLFDQLRFGVALDAAANARSAAAPWPADAAPWFWPGWVAMLAFAISVGVLLLAAVGLRLPDVVVLGLAAVLTATTVWAARATLDVLNAGLWELIPACIVCVLAVGLAATATARWRSTPGQSSSGEGLGGVAAATLAAWLVVVLVLLAGAAIAASARTHAFGDVDSPPQGLPGLLSIRASDGPQLDGYQGFWMAQLTAAQVADDDASAYAVRHRDRSVRLPTLLVRGDDTGAPDLDDTWWVTLVRQSFQSRAAVESWCAENGLAPPDCTPRLITD
jgi:hypothetical protein